MKREKGQWGTGTGEMGIENEEISMMSDESSYKDGHL